MSEIMAACRERDLNEGNLTPFQLGSKVRKQAPIKSQMPIFL